MARSDLGCLPHSDAPEITLNCSMIEDLRNHPLTPFLRSLASIPPLPDQMKGGGLINTCSQRGGTLWQGQALGYAQTGGAFNITDVEAPEHRAFCEWLSKEYRYSLSLDAHNVQQFRKAESDADALNPSRRGLAWAVR